MKSFFEFRTVSLLYVACAASYMHPRPEDKAVGPNWPFFIYLPFRKTGKNRKQTRKKVSNPL